MNQLELRPGKFTYSPEDDSLRQTLPIINIFIDGADFIKQVREWTYDETLSPLEPKMLYEMLHHEWKNKDKVFIGGGSCGQAMCNPLYAHIEEKKYTIIWSDITHPVDEPERAYTQRLKMNPIIFDKEAYFAELAKMKDWLIENIY